MRSMKFIVSFIMIFSFPVYSETSSYKEICMNLYRSEDVSVCIMDNVKKNINEYKAEFNSYLKSIDIQEKSPYDKKSILKLAKGAKKDWESFIKKECLIESAKYEENSSGFNNNYNLCLIKNYHQRIEYYRKNIF